MKKIIFLFLLGIISTVGFAQKTIVITGKGFENIAPDQVNISLNLEQKDANYQQCVKELNERIKTLTNAFKKSGFDASSIKTSNYNLRQETRYNRQTSKNEFVGYMASYQISIKFPFKQKLIDKAFDAMVGSLTHVNFNMGYSIANPNKIKGQLITMAVEDAKKKASILSNASGIELGEILSIEYSEKMPTSFPTPYRVMLKGQQADTFSAPEANPEDIKMSDQVTITWKIK